METSQKRIVEIRKMVETQHGRQCHPDRGEDFGENLCCHIHTLGMPFGVLAQHFGISLFELADLVADHIRRLKE